MRCVLLLACFVAIAAASDEPTWGPAGHQVTATVAQALLSSTAASQVATLLGGQSLSQVANWADQVKTNDPYKWSAVLHFINTPDWACDYMYSRDCKNAICVSGAIKNYTKRLYSHSLPSAQRAEALKFLVHFIGDIHQPMHVGFTSDRGGNNIEGTFLGQSDNLHYIWDTPFPQMRISDAGRGSQSSYANYLLQQMQSTYSNNVTYWSSCSGGALSCPDDWAEETIGYTCTHAYVDQNGNEVKNGFVLDRGYYNFNTEVIDLQILKGGVRLATTLNRILGSSSDVKTSENDVDNENDATDFDSDLDQLRQDLISNRYEMMQSAAQARQFFQDDRSFVESQKTKE